MVVKIVKKSWFDQKTDSDQIYRQKHLAQEISRIYL